MSDRERRTRKLTIKAQAMFDEQSEKLREKCEGEWSKIEDLMITAPSCTTLESLRKLNKDLDSNFKNFCRRSEEYKSYLNRTNTTESKQLITDHMEHFTKCVETYRKVDSDIKKRKLELVETMSEVSVTSVSSSASHKRAKAEAEKVRLEFVKKESELMKQKASIEADISIVKQESKVAAAETEARILEQGERDQDIVSEICDKKEEVNEYIQNIPPSDQMTTMITWSTHQTIPSADPVASQNMNVSSTHQTINATNPVYSQPTYQPVHPPFHMQNTSTNSLMHNTISDITRLMYRKDFLLSRFSNFDDKAETYASWKASFQSVTQELGVTPFEEMDLLIKWLGPDSSRFAKSIRAANTHDPATGLQRIYERLEERYGRPEMVESALKRKIVTFPTITNKDCVKLYDLLDILTEVESVMLNPKYATLLSYYNSSSGVTPIVAKLPHFLQEKWTTQASSYKKFHNLAFPPFKFFVSFIRDMCEIRNDPAFLYNSSSSSATGSNKPRSSVISRRFDVTSNKSVRCPLHKAGHTLNDCRGFRKQSLQDRQKFLRDKRICFKCCESDAHFAKNCSVNVKCQICGNRHATALHVDRQFQQKETDNQTTSQVDGGEKHESEDNVRSKCTTLCGELRFSRSCGKTVLVNVYSDKDPMNCIKAYAAVDDQSNRTLITPELLDRLGIQGTKSQFTMSSCSGKSTIMCRVANAINVQSIDGKSTFELHDVIECDSIPSDLPEVATPDVALAYSHLHCIAPYLPALDPSIKVELLIGRDVPEIHHVQEQIIGGKGEPFAQKLPLGWTVIGEVCLGKVHAPKEINVRITHTLNDGRCTTFPLCEKNIEINDFSDEIFIKTSDDNKVGFSVEDKRFLKLMESDFVQDDTGHWTAPLPFKQPKPPIPNNRSQAWKRAQILDSSLRKNPIKQKHFMTFMEKVLNSGAAEKAPTDIPGECWYLPLFGVYHPRKLDQIRGVFDSSAVYEGVSLNSLLMSGPDLINNLVGILMRFRKNSIAVTGDIEQMFYQFRVSDKHRDYLRFFWYQNNDFTQPLIEYRMTSHVFGNTPSPAIATYGIRRAVEHSDDDVKSFVCKDFYVDDGITSLTDENLAIDLIKKTQKDLKENGDIRFHKIVSNNIHVMEAFPSDDLGKDLKSLDLHSDILPTQRSLGITWDLHSDKFIFSVSNDEKPTTRRGLLSTINSLFDPLGFVSPILISGKILLRDVIPPGTDWDEPLSSEHACKWQYWLESLRSIGNFEIPRMVIPTSVSLAEKLEVHIFCDASEQAISSVAYLKSVDKNGSSSLGFLMGKTKLAPLKGHTIPRLELCSAVLATELGDMICDNMNFSRDICHYYTDSQVVLGYICNTTRRFFTYVSNRVEKIHKVSKPSQWSHVTTDKNPADAGTRYSKSPDMTLVNCWITGPTWLLSENSTKCEEDYGLVSPNEDKEIRPKIVTLKTQISEPQIGCHRFSKFSTWKSLIRAFSYLRLFVKRWLSKHKNQQVPEINSEFKKETEIFIIKQIQSEVFKRDIENLKANTPVSKDSSVLKLDPFLDKEGVMRVGGRLKFSELTLGEKHPILIPNSHHIGKLLVSHHHELAKHQGRHITEGVIRSAGLWIIGLKRLVYSVISKCLLCRRFRGNLTTQKMSDLPKERLKSCPPFTYVGVDCFGPYDIVTRRTRGGSINSKRWAVLFSCMSCRAVHIEVIEEMSTSSFINALRRFMSIRGKVKEFYSDRGTNFIGAAKELGIPGICVEDNTLKSFLCDKGSVWKFNTPYSSHMGGSWERLIGIARRIIDSILYEARHKKLTHEVLCTFMAETTAIMNSRPLIPVSSDSDSPCVLSPNTLLTTKTGDCNEDFSHLNTRDVYTTQWKFVQSLAEQFWTQWRHQYLHTLQSRRKWQQTHDNIKEGDVVILKDGEQHRNFWPIGLIEHVFPSKDNLVRKVLVRTIKDGQARVYVRPITQTVLLCHQLL